MPGPIVNGNQRRIGAPETVLDVSDALVGLTRPLVVTRIAKSMQDHEVAEGGTDLPCEGFLAPLSPRQLALKPEGQRAWSWYQLITTRAIALSVDDRAEIENTPYRVVALNNFSAYGFFEYHLVEDFTGDTGVTMPASTISRTVYFDGSTTAMTVDVSEVIADATLAVWTVYAPDNTAVDGAAAPNSPGTVVVTIAPAPAPGNYRLVGVS